MVKPEQRGLIEQLYPAVEHPLAPRHEVHRASVSLRHHNFVQHIAGVSDDESRQLMRLLTAQAETIEYQCRFHWTTNAVAFWDNRAVQHYAASDYWPDVRVMERASIIGPRPVR